MKAHLHAPRPPPFPQVGFIGLGNMGKHMAANLIKSGHQLTVFDREWCAAASRRALGGLGRVDVVLNPSPRFGAVSTQAVQELQGKGATAAVSAAAASAGADVVVTMLPSSPHVREVYEGAQGVFSAVSAGTLLVDCSTIDPNVSRALARAAESRKLRLVDAPVSGGVGGAERGTLTFMVGSAPGEFEAVKPLLEAMGKNIVHCGPAGTGQVAKICNNMVLGISMHAVCEAMNLGVKLGADPRTLAGIINTSSGRCWSSDTYNPVPGVMPDVPSARGYAGGFGSALMLKDLGLALDAGKAVGAALPTAGAALATYQLMLTQGLGGKDFSAVYAFLAGSLPERKA